MIIWFRELKPFQINEEAVGLMMQIQKCIPLKRKSFSILTNWCTHPSSVQIVWNYPTSQTAASPTHPLSLCLPHSSSKHSKNQLCWNEFNPQVSTVTPLCAFESARRCWSVTHDLTFAWPSDDLQLGVTALGSEELATRCEGPAVGGAQGLARSSTAFHVALLVLIHPQELQRWEEVRR